MVKVFKELSLHHVLRWVYKQHWDEIDCQQLWDCNFIVTWTEILLKVIDSL